MYLLVAVEVTSRLRRQLGERTWRTLHWLSVVLLVASTVHGFSAGTDATDLAVVSPAMGVMAFAGGVLWWRVRHGRLVGASRQPTAVPVSASTAPTNR